MSRLRPALILAALLATLTTARAAHIRTPLQIPMRDGALLAADRYTPDPARPLPVVLIQTPYNKNLMALAFSGDAPGRVLFGSEDYAFVIVDWRGRFGSRNVKGPAVGQDGADGYDSVEWIAAQPWCSGEVGTWGPSALGVAQYRTAGTQPPHLACCVPMVAAAYYRYETFYPGGALREEYVDMLDTLGFGMKPAISRATTKNRVWEVLASRWRPDRIKVPMLLVGGWHDIHATEVPQDFVTLRRYGAPEVRGEHRLLMGPWTHSAIDKPEQGELAFPLAEGECALQSLRFFDRWLRGAEPEKPAAPVRYFQMGEDTWHEADDWDYYQNQGYYLLHLGKGGELAWTPSQETGADSYTHDPGDPAPTVGGAVLDWRQVPPGPCDQRERVESRKDVLTYTTPPLEENLPVTGAGLVKLNVTSDRPDTDFAVRLCDVHPDGRSMLVTDGITRARFRTSLSDPEPLTPGERTEVNVWLPPTAMTFLKGHRIRVIVGSANWPRFSVNHNDGDGTGESFVAHNRVHWGGESGSKVQLPAGE